MKWIGLVLLTAAACGAASQQPNGMASSFAAPRAEFGSYETFSFGLADAPKPGYDVTPRSLEVRRRLQPLVLEALRARGYKDDATKADFVVKLAAGTGVASPPPSRGAEAYGDPAESTGVDVAEGYIGINIYDAATGSEVWQVGRAGRLSQLSNRYQSIIDASWSGVDCPPGADEYGDGYRC